MEGLELDFVFERMVDEMDLTSHTHYGLLFNQIVTNVRCQLVGPIYSPRLIEGYPHAMMKIASNPHAYRELAAYFGIMYISIDGRIAVTR